MNTIKCPHCGEQTPDVESGMGYITCENCGKTFSSNDRKRGGGYLCGGEDVAFIKVDKSMLEFVEILEGAVNEARAQYPLNPCP